jgi:hypothetical protein
MRAFAWICQGIALAQEADEKFRISTRVHHIDEQYHVTATVGAAVDTGKKALQEFDQEYQISASVSAKAAEIDQKLGVTETVESAKAAVLSNPTVQAGLSTLTGWGSSLASSFSLFSSETKVRAHELHAGKSASSGSTPQPGVSM